MAYVQSIILSYLDLDGQDFNALAVEQNVVSQVAGIVKKIRDMPFVNVYRFCHEACIAEAAHYNTPFKVSRAMTDDVIKIMALAFSTLAVACNNSEGLFVEKVECLAQFLLGSTVPTPISNREIAQLGQDALNFAASIGATYSFRLLLAHGANITGKGHIPKVLKVRKDIKEEDRVFIGTPLMASLYYCQPICRQIIFLSNDWSELDVLQLSELYTAKELVSLFVNRKMGLNPLEDHFTKMGDQDGLSLIDMYKQKFRNYDNLSKTNLQSSSSVFSNATLRLK